MMRSRCAIVFVLFSQVAFSQKQILRKPISVGTQSILTSSIWADNDGYQILDFQFQGHQHILKLVHEQYGELGTLDKILFLTPENVFGLTSNEKELTLYFRGLLNGKKDYYFMTFFKDGKRQPIITNWLNDEVKGDIVFSYNFNNKLYLIKEHKKGFNFIEVEDYSKSRTIFVPKSELEKVSDRSEWDAVTVETPAIAATCKFSTLKLYPASDSLLIISDRESLDATFLIHLNYNSGKVTSRILPAEKSLEGYNSMILGNRLYRMTKDKKTFGLYIYEFPSLQLLKEFKYTEDQNVNIKINQLTNERGKVIEKDRHDDVADEKVVTKIIRSDAYPYFSILYDSVTVLDITFQQSSSGSMHQVYGQPGMMYSSGSSTYEYTFKACFTEKFEPCNAAIAQDESRKIIFTEEVKRDSKSSVSSFAENRTNVFALHYENKEYYIEKYEKNVR